MLRWLKGLSTPTRHQRRPEPDAATGHRSASAGKYVSLYKYLESRYADTVVLTFAQIEDLLGFTLPDLARLRADWWTHPDPDRVRPSYSDSWILASRTAQPNLAALTVVFARAA